MLTRKEAGMSHQDQSVALNADCLKKALCWLVAGIGWSKVKFRDDCTYTPRLLAGTAMLWAWSDEITLVDRFHAVRRIIQFLFPMQQELAGSYQAFIKLLRRWTPQLVAVVQTALRRRMDQALSDCWEIYGYVMFGVDGSRLELPRTRSHEAAYSAARRGSKSAKRRSKRGRCRRRSKRGNSKRRSKKGRSNGRSKKANSPQMWITTMWHAVTGLPWDWRTGPADSSERTHLLQMLVGLPLRALVAADAGFVGYRYAKEVIDSGRELLVRVGANVHLLRKLGWGRESGGIVYLWPDQQAKRNQPPLVLRLVVAHNGKHPVYLVTSVLSTLRLSDSQVIELYARRWGIEVFYRHLKQTFGRRKLRSTNADNARIEIEWSLVGLWAMALYALVETNKQGIPPGRLSIAQTLRSFRRMLRDYRHPRERGCRLRDLLRKAVVDSYDRKNKTSRDYPRKKQEKPPGAPTITNANKQQIQHAKQIRPKQPKTGLTA